MNGNGDERWLRGLALLQGMRAGGSESQIHAQETVNIRTRVALPAGHGLAVFVFGLAGIGGLALAGSGLADEPATWWKVWIGLVGAVAATSVAVNQLRYIRNPYWPTSPFEQGFLKLLRAVFKQMQEDEPEEPDVAADPRPAYRVNGFRSARAPLPATTQPAQVLPPEPDQDAAERAVAERWERDLAAHGLDENGQPIADVEPDSETGNLVWFALYVAPLRDLKLSTIYMKPEPWLPFREGGSQRFAHLNKRWIRRLLARGSTEPNLVDVDGYKERGLGPQAGWWHIGPQGRPAEWAKPREQVVEEALILWRDMAPDLPPPNYWEDADNNAT